LEADKDAHEPRAEAAEAAIKSYRKALEKHDDKKCEARLREKIGKAYRRLGRLAEALVWLTDAKESHLEVKEVSGAIDCLNVIAEIKRQQCKSEEELAAYDQIVTIVEPEAMHLHVAAAENARGLRLMEMGRHPEAKRAFDKAELLCRENPQFLKLAPFFAENLQRAQHRLKELLPPENDLWELVHELHELVAFFPEAKESYLPFWYWYRDAEIRSCVRASAGLKFLILENEVGEFLSAADQLSFVSDLCLQAVTNRFAKSAEYWQQPGHVDRGCRGGKEVMDRKTMDGWDLIPFPLDKTVPSAVAILVNEMRDGKEVEAFKRGGHHSEYFGFTFFLTSKVTGSKAFLIAGKSRLLPEQAYNLMLGHSVDELKSRKTAFLSEERYFKNDKLAFDLNLSTTLGLIPVYTRRLPRSDDVEVLRGGQVELAFPLPPQKSKAVIQSKLGEVKRKLVRLLSLKDNEALAALTEIAGQLDELRAVSGAGECIRMTAYLLRFPVHGAMQTHLALVRHSG
jgi:tetratricopeptide (TPR) repeat protein